MECRGCGKYVDSWNNGICDECWDKGNVPTNSEIEAIARIKELNKNNPNREYYTHEEMKKLLLEDDFAEEEGDKNV